MQMGGGWGDGGGERGRVWIALILLDDDNIHNFCFSSKLSDGKDWGACVCEVVTQWWIHNSRIAHLDRQMNGNCVPSLMCIKSLELYSDC